MWKRRFGFAGGRDGQKEKEKGRDVRDRQRLQRVVAVTPRTTLQRFLAKHHACAEARAWVGRKSLATAWRTCRNASYLNWLLSKTQPGFRCCTGCAGWTAARDAWKAAAVRAAVRKRGITIALPKAKRA
jgi:hypothetical protein